jgi:hypothetical protein
MRTKWLWLLTLGLVVGWLSPCLAQFEPETMKSGLLPSAYYESAVQQIKVGETSEAQVIKILGQPQHSAQGGQDKQFHYGPLPGAQGETVRYAVEITINSGKVSKVTTNIPQ